MRSLTVTDSTSDRIQALLTTFSGIPTEKLRSVRQLYDDVLTASVEGAFLDLAHAEPCIGKIEAAVMETAEAAQGETSLEARMGKTFDAIHGGGPDDIAELSNDAA